MKKFLLIAILGAIGYWVSTGAAATEWKALRFWVEHREALPMLEARANWALAEIEESKPKIGKAPTTTEELEALAKELMKSSSPEGMPAEAQSLTQDELEAHRDRSVALTGYSAIRDAAASTSFHRENDTHLSVLGSRLDSDHFIIVWSPLAEVLEPPIGTFGISSRRVLGWRTALNLSTRERLATMLDVTQRGTATGR